MEKQQPPWHWRLRHERKRRNWSQAEVANRIGSDPKTVSRWEQGRAFPSAYHRQKLAELFEKDAEELGLIEEAGLSIYEDPSTQRLAASHPILPVGMESITDLSQREHALSVFGESDGDLAASERADLIFWHEDWGEAPSIDSFYGRAQDLADVMQWIIDERCRMVVVLGMGGVGKTTFATMAGRRVSYDFEYIFWRSLQNAPTVEHILESCLQSFSDQQSVDGHKDLDEQISLLITFLRTHRCLLLLDNVESILQAGQRAGHYAEEFKGYGRLFQRIGQSQHQSCLILTSREKPREVGLLEGHPSPVRTLTLAGVEQVDGQLLLESKNLFGSEEIWSSLIHAYSGNPLALKLIAEPIRDVFGGDIAAFLQTQETVFGEIYDLLNEQFQRLSNLEQQVMYWLASEREAVALSDLRDMMPPGSTGPLLEAVESLRRRSLLESGGDGRFTLQPVIMEYVTAHFVEQIAHEIATGTIKLLGSHALIKAQSKDYIRESQVRFILAPIAERLLTLFEKAGCEEALTRLLATLRQVHPQASSYAAGNVLNLLLQMKANVRGVDFSHLRVRQAYVQGVELPEVNFAHANLATSVFTDIFSSVLCVAVSPNGELLAGATTTGEVRLWRIAGATPLFTCLGHTDGVRAVAFSHDGRLLVSGSEDQSIRLWDTSSGRCLKTLQGHSSLVRAVACSPTAPLLASASEDQTICLWDMTTGERLHILREHTGWVRAVAFSPDGHLLASGADDQTVRLWDTATGDCLDIFSGHSHQVRAVSFSPTGTLLATGSEDQTIRLWDVQSGQCLHILHGHTQRVRALAFSPTGDLLASSSDDHTIRLWESSTWQCFKVLQRHTNRIWSVAFVPDGKMLMSASEDDTLRFWEIPGGRCLRTLQGHTNLIKTVAFSPDGQLLVSGNEDQILRLWHVRTGQCLKLFHGHANRIKSATFSPDGTIIASASEDETIRLWETQSGQCLTILRGHAHIVRCVAFNSDGKQLASSSYDQTVRLWDVGSGHCLNVLTGHINQVWSVAFSPNGTMLASSGEDQTVRLWDVHSGQCLNILRGHRHRVVAVALSPDGTMLASGSDDTTIRLWDVNGGDCLYTLQGHTLPVRSVAFSPDGATIASGSHDRMVRLWEVSSGRCFTILPGHTNCVWSVAFSPDGRSVASCGDDGTIRIWDVQTGACTSILRNESPYERMDITNVRGLMEAQKVILKTLGAIEKA